jgi:hypothetical protein
MLGYALPKNVPQLGLRAAAMAALAGVIARIFGIA